MLIGNVIGNVWATKKESTLSGAKLMIVREIDAAGNGTDNTFVAADVVGAG
ncbi:EutN/CcmL family microcompartment protein, partial [Candidatus Collinsella stercoripullorum]|uniref:EutN/CcmL family microcompartment protein n=1 Tax=Candidatus Collinsella stercoripullorum TaxID=2838522 RepID=UPI003A521928